MSEILTNDAGLMPDDETRVFQAYLAAEQSSGITLNAEQQEAVVLAALAIERRLRQFTIHGLAGTGKTVVLSFLARMYPEANVVAPTGKAALVMSQKMGRRANTIHSLFYVVVDEETTENGKTNPVFGYCPQIADESIVLLDECSMVDEETRDDILATGATLIAVGDQGQLPPVQRNPGFVAADYVLKQIQRQAAGSPIIQEAYRARKGGGYLDNGHPEFRVVRGLSNLTDADLLASDIVLCWRNQTAANFNQHIRKLKFGHTSKYAKTGEPVMCLRNWHDHGIQNGGIYECLESYKAGAHKITIGVRDKPVELSHVDWAVQPKKPMKTSFDFGYCITVHKSQGSEWDKVILLDEYNGREDRAKWLYTGITRAAKSIIVVKM